MKKVIYVFICFLLLGNSINGQVRKGNKEKIRTLKIGYITEQLELTEAEAEKFWPIYNLYDKQLMSLKTEERNLLKKQLKNSNNLDALSEKESKDVVAKILLLSESFYETKQQMFQKLAKVISYKKIIKLEITEKEFNRKLIRKLRKKEKK